MRVERALACACAALCLLALSTEARAQRNVDLERLQPALDGRGFLGVQGTRTPGHGRASYGLSLGYASDLYEVAGSGALVSDRVSAWLSAQLGVGPRAAFALAAPMSIYQAGDDAELQAYALGDARLHARYRFLGAVAKDVLDREDGPGLALALDAILPSGDDDRFTGEGALRGEAQLLGDLHLLGAGLGARLGYRHRFEERTLLGRELVSELTFGAALRMPVPPLHPLVALLEVRGATDFQSEKTTALEGQLGVLLPLGDVTLALAAGPGLYGAVGVPAFRVHLSLWYAPKPVDADADGVDDDVDACPPLPEDRDGHEDQDGCPDPDNDNDLVPDADDLCPNAEALEGQDQDEDGCTDKR